MWLRHQVIQPREAVVSCFSAGQGYTGLKIYSQTWLKSIWSLSGRDSYYLHCSCVCLKIDLIFLFSMSCFTFPVLSFFSLFTSPFLMNWWWFRLGFSVASQPSSPLWPSVELTVLASDAALDDGDYRVLMNPLKFYHKFSRLLNYCPLGYRGYSPHTLTPHTHKCSSIK